MTASGRATLSTFLFLAAAGSARADAPVVRNEEPALPPVTLELEELWRRGAENDDVMIGLPVEALADERGRVYLADQQLCQVFVFGPEG